MARVTTTKLLQYAAVAISFIPMRGALAQSQIPLKLDHGALTSESEKSVIVHMFEWTWDSIAAECTEFLGPAGYGYVQASPAQEHVQGPHWWTDYQPVSYNLTPKRGNRQQFANMIKTCHSAGVKVIADTIFNHMAQYDNGVGVGGSEFSHYDYPGIYHDSDGDFHHCHITPDNQIVDYKDRKQVQTCELNHLADLATETEHVRSRLAEYANDLLSLGVDGLRLDAAKHIAAEDLYDITRRFTSKPYITQEVIWGPGEPIVPAEYQGIGDVQEFRYTRKVESAFLKNGISDLQYLDSQGWIPSATANVFVTNHDTERYGDSLNINSPSNTYVTATIFSLAYPYGTPTVLSSYSWADQDVGAPNGGAGTCSGTGGSNGWFCQHRWAAFTGMVGFRNNVGSALVTNWVSPQKQQIAFERDSLGFVAINNDDAGWPAPFHTSLPDGLYCDVISGKSQDDRCTGAWYNVSGGTFLALVPARSALAIHTGATGQGSTTYVAVNIAVRAETAYGQNIFLAGDMPELGSWNPNASLPLSPVSYPIWMVSLPLAPNTKFAFKFIRKETDGTVVWESDPDRQGILPSSGSYHINTEWR